MPYIFILLYCSNIILSVCVRACVWLIYTKTYVSEGDIISMSFGLRLMREGLIGLM